MSANNETYFTGADSRFRVTATGSDLLNGRVEISLMSSSGVNDTIIATTSIDNTNTTQTFVDVILTDLKKTALLSGGTNANVCYFLVYISSTGNRTNIPKDKGGEGSFNLKVPGC